jgi:hypothetical protein
VIETPLAHRLEELEPGLAIHVGRALHERLGVERPQEVGGDRRRRLVDGGGDVHRERARDDREAREQAALVVGQEVDRPVDRGS